MIECWSVQNQGTRAPVKRRQHQQ